jgi:hypothetical protein
MTNETNGPKPQPCENPYWESLQPSPAAYAGGAQPTMPAIHPDALTFVRTQLGIEPDPKQAWILTGRHERLLINCTRQWGKSTITAAAVLHRLLTEPGKTVIVLCPVLRQSSIFVGIVKSFVRRLGIKVRGDGENQVSVLLPNGSRVVGLPGRSGDRIRGFHDIIMLVIDEAARLADPVYYSAYPMVTQSEADIWALTTPLGKKGFFYNSWAHGGEAWERLQAPATECPRIPAHALERARLDLGDEWVRQEYLCEFVDLEGSVFSRQRIEDAFKDSVTVLGDAIWN